MRKAQKLARRAETRQARLRRARHLGGPGREDYKRGRVKGEVKNWKNRVPSSVITKAARRKVKEITSKSGFTGPAREKAHKAGIKLIVRGKVLKRR